MSLVSGYYWTYKQGSVGKVLAGTLKDANGNFEITGAVTVTAKRQGSTIAVINDEPCAPAADQVANTGDFTYTLDVDSAAVDPGTYNLEFKHTAGSNISIWPDDPNSNKQYGKLVVTASL
jgi:hypothetical protein